MGKESRKLLTGLKRVCSLAQPSVSRAVPHVHTVPPGHTAGSSTCRKCFLCIGPLSKAGLPRVKSGGGKGIIVAGGTRWKLRREQRVWRD